MGTNNKKLIATGIFTDMTDDEIQAFASSMKVLEFAASDDASDIRSYSLLLDGEIRVYKGDLEVGHLLPGDGFGAWGLWGWVQHRVMLKAKVDTHVAVWDEKDVCEIISKYPNALLKVVKNFSRVMDERLEELTQALLRAYSAPAQHVKPSIVIKINGEERTVRTGTTLSQLLPKEVNGAAVLAGLFNHKLFSLNRPVYTSGTLEPLTVNGLEGRNIYRTSLDLLALEAAYQIDPKIKLRIGPSLGFAHLFEFDEQPAYSMTELAKKMNAKIRELVEQNVVFRREYFSIDEATSIFDRQGWDDAIKICHKMRNSSVALVSCGHLYAIEFSPLVASAGVLNRFEVVPCNNDLLLYFGDSETKKETIIQGVHPGRLAKQHDLWLKTVGLTSVGAFNDICISGDISNIIRVSEGFHEKRISQIADMIVQRERPVKVICISGPSSSGKTTFLKRLSTQLQVNGLTPRCISLDNYYVNRELTVKDENGEYDFEAFEALNIDLLRKQLKDLVDGKAIHLALYDFASGINHPEGGPLMQLTENDVLLLEGIHALNPRLPVDQGDGVFRIFINPMTSLVLDHASRVSASDIRLIRRIVRDRHTRAITAASNINRWPSVRRGETKHIFPYQELADAVFNTSLVYELSVLKVYAERYLLEVKEDDPAYAIAFRLRRLIDKIVSIHPDNVPQTSLLREFIGFGI